MINIPKNQIKSKISTLQRTKKNKLLIFFKSKAEFQKIASGIL